MEIKEIPEDLKEYEENLATGTGAYGGIVLENGNLHWYNSWVGDAGDETTQMYGPRYSKNRKYEVNLPKRIEIG